jgi:hypothetical protein
MSDMNISESRARLGYLLSEMLALSNLPVDLNQMISDHLQKQLSLVNILKPEYCLRLYPVLAELAELTARDAEAQASAEEAPAGKELAAAVVSAEPPAEVVNGSSAPTMVLNPAITADPDDDSPIDDENGDVEDDESDDDESSAKIVNGPIHDQVDHFNLSSAEQTSQEEMSESY